MRTPIRTATLIRVHRTVGGAAGAFKITFDHRRQTNRQLRDQRVFGDPPGALCPAHSRNDTPRSCGIGGREQDDELVSADADDKVRFADGRHEQIGRTADERIARGVAELVVDGLEAIEIAIHDERTRAGPSGAPGVDLVVPHVAVCTPRQGIGAHQAGEQVAFGGELLASVRLADQEFCRVGEARPIRWQREVNPRAPATV